MAELTNLTQAFSEFADSVFATFPPNTEFRQKGIVPAQFQFQPGEVTLRSIFRHLKTHEVTGEIVEDWFVVIPQLRVYR